MNINHYTFTSSEMIVMRWNMMFNMKQNGKQFLLIGNVCSGHVITPHDAQPPERYRPQSHELIKNIEHHNVPPPES